MTGIKSSFLLLYLLQGTAVKPAFLLNILVSLLIQNSLN